MKYLAAIISILLGANGQYFLKLGVNKITKITTSPFVIKDLIIDFLKNGYLWIGLASYGFSMIFWLYVLSQLELSKAYPLASLGYVLTMLIGAFLLGESINIYKIIGLILIILGVIFINH